MPAIEALRETLQSGSRENPHLTGRLEEPTFIVLLGRIERLDTRTCRVASEEALERYIVQSRQYECPDFVRHGEGRYWKHRLACGPLARLNGDGNREANGQNGHQTPREASGSTLTSQARTLSFPSPRGARTMTQPRPPMSRAR